MLARACADEPPAPAREQPALELQVKLLLFFRAEAEVWGILKAQWGSAEAKGLSPLKA